MPKFRFEELPSQPKPIKEKEEDEPIQKTEEFLEEESRESTEMEEKYSVDTIKEVADKMVSDRSLGRRKEFDRRMVRAWLDASTPFRWWTREMLLPDKEKREHEEAFGRVSGFEENIAAHKKEVLEKSGFREEELEKLGYIETHPEIVPPCVQERYPEASFWIRESDDVLCAIAKGKVIPITEEKMGKEFKLEMEREGKIKTAIRRIENDVPFLKKLLKETKGQKTDDVLMGLMRDYVVDYVKEDAKVEEEEAKEAPAVEKLPEKEA